MTQYAMEKHKRDGLTKSGHFLLKSLCFPLWLIDIT